MNGYYSMRYQEYTTNQDRPTFSCLRMISEAGRRGEGVNKLPTRFTKEKIE